MSRSGSYQYCDEGLRLGSIGTVIVSSLGSGGKVLLGVD